MIVEREKINSLLIKIVDTLDIPDQFYEDAVLKYEDVGSWLAADDSKLKPYSPEVYSQGSFRLGTVVRPISNNDEYDIDLVCLLNVDKTRISQTTLKQIIGDRLRQHPDLTSILTPGKRCWKLDYPFQAQMPQFHMDVLPAIPNSERLPTGIMLTDRELTQWQKSNPKAYSGWFYDRMKTVFLARRAELAKAANVEEVPEWQVKTPLQRVIQILKRHRDIYFQGNPENKPASIIITTLIARAYNSQSTIYDALIESVHSIQNNWGKPGFVENRNGRWWIANPVESEENFADKWNDHPERRDAFQRWVRRVWDDLVDISKKQTLSEVVDLLAATLGEQVVSKVAIDLGLRARTTMPAIFVPQVQVPAIGNTQHCLNPQWPVKEYYHARVDGSVYYSYKGRKLWELTNRPVPKKLWLRFSVKTNVPSPFNVQWQVVNTGEEAAKDNQLRGDFYENDEIGSNIRWERTLYKGTHWVEAFIIKDGVCVARSGHKIVKIR